MAGPCDRERVAADHGRYARMRTRASVAPGGGALAATTAAGSADTTVAVYQRDAGQAQHDRYICRYSYH